MTQFVTSGEAGKKVKTVILFIASLAGTASLGVASAAPSDAKVPTLILHYSEQSLAANGGVDDLYRRIASAAKRVCPNDSIHDIRALAQIDVCRREAVARAVQQIHNSQLAALSASRAKNG
jgi:UrcA family protein